MKNVLEDICTKLKERAYSNEEQIRFSLVGRILLELGWDIWEPKEVVTEFPVAKTEDKTKVDIALFLRTNLPYVYIEVKAHEKMVQNLGTIEKQLRDYNRNNTAAFTVITDGQHWRFYYSHTSGEFSDKCYLTIDLLNEDVNALEDAFFAVLSKKSVGNGDAKKYAEEHLELSQKERAMETCMPKVKKLTDENPLMSKVDAFEICMKELGYTITKPEILKFYIKISKMDASNTANPARSTPREPTAKQREEPPVTGKHNELPAPEQTGKREKLSVSFPDNTRFSEGKPTEVFLKTIEKIGTELVKNLNIMRCKIPLVSTAKDKKYPQHQIGRYWIMTNLSTHDKFKVLTEINEGLGLRLRIEKH
jgi:Type I restriction enzyme R protein N terminus (HSDR_N)